MLVIFMLFLLALDIHFYIPILAFVFLFAKHWNIKLIKSQDNSFQILTILHSINEVSADDEGLVWEWVVWTENLTA